MDRLKLFVPGRLCLFGEHSDWAGGFRQGDRSITPGYCLIVGTDQGIHAEIEPCPGWFEISSFLPGSTERKGPYRFRMQPDALLHASRTPGFAIYAAGTACEVLRRYPVDGIRINACRMDLPLKKGLSSSAAVCVLVARALNRVYGLNLDIRQEMELAYRGEILTGSRCGRMDQVCAFGKIPTFLTFDGDDMRIEPLSTERDLHLLIVDLKGEKNTRKILEDLNHCFERPDNRIGRNLREGLGVRNESILSKARTALETGDARLLGMSMTEAQENFDSRIAPACPDELQAPRLHTVLNHPAVRELGEGGKGVGSQGDGCAQLVFSDPGRRSECTRILKSELDVVCLNLDIPAGGAYQ
ncbi:GHMP kinase [bacterium]|nr:GHMP kinase [candidate division CSSED10-310 bacterium]